jgi:PelA/Pel-15E family pectate lyase
MKCIVDSALHFLILAATCAACAAGEVKPIELEVETMVGAADWIEVKESASKGKWVRLSDYNVTLEGDVHLPAGPVTVTVHGYRDDSQSDGFRIQVDDGLLRRVSIGGNGVISFTEIFAKPATHRIILMSDVKDKGVCLDVVRFTSQSVETTPWQTDVPDPSDGRTRLATEILCSFDKVEERDQPGRLFADYARGNPRPNIRTVGFETPPGGQSLAAHFLTSGSSVVFDGRSNCRTDRGRVDFRVRADDDSNFWADGKDHGMFAISAVTSPSAYGLSGTPFRLSLEKRARSNVLVLQLAERDMLWLPVEALAPSEWHHISIAWRLRENGGRMWLAVNGKGMSAPISQRVAATPAEGIVLGNTLRDAYWGTDAYIDDFRLGEDAPDDGLAGVINADAIDFDRAFHAQEALRRWLELQKSLAPDGLWHRWYGWPVTRFFLSKGKRVPRGNEQISMKAGGPTRMATHMLHAFEVSGDWRYLQLARRTGAFLLKAQQPEGHWLADYAIPDGEPQGRNSVGRIQDHYQSDPTIFLVYLYRMTGDKRYLQSAVRCADFLVAAQNPNGSWCGNFDAKKGVGATSVQNVGEGGEFNDAGISAPVATLLLMHHVSGDEKYRNAALRAFDWVLAAELKGGKGRGWAQQYDARNNPVWARFHEPPVVCPRVFAYYVGDLMLWAYRLTGEPKYIEAIRPTVEWMRGVRRPDGFHFYYDTSSGKPVYGRDFKIYPYHDDPAENTPNPAGFSGYYPYDIKPIETALRAINARTFDPERWKPARTTSERRSRRKAALAKLQNNALDDGKTAWVTAGFGGWLGGTLDETLEEQHDWGGWLAPRHAHGYDIEDRSSILFRYVELVRVACDLAPVDLGTSDGSGGLGTQRAWFIDGGFDAPPSGSNERGKER